MSDDEFDFWLDKTIAEQAAYYSMTVPEFNAFMSTIADIQETVEREDR